MEGEKASRGRERLGTAGWVRKPLKDGNVASGGGGDGGRGGQSGKGGGWAQWAG